LPDHEPIHRVSLSWVNHNSVIRLVCRACAVRIGGQYKTWRELIACQGCGRTVIHDINRQPPRYVICGEQCRRTVRATLAREKRGQPSERHCQTCGGVLASQRADVRHCSSPCRQKAYRQRRHQAVS
jgi:hypothetical protein